MKLEWFELSDTETNSWDEFMLQHPHGSIHQTTAWKDFQVTIPGREIVKGYGVRDPKTKQILAATLVIKMHTGLGKKYWWYSPRGPVFEFQKNSEAGNYLIQTLASKLQKTNALFWRLDPYFTKSDWKNLDLATLKGHPATQNYQPTDSLEIDLTQTDEDILAAMKRKGRFIIILARKKGVTIKTLT
jgi:lipid II:glycine glycyltransferase (peptidoglycan interpeptide bridge formation enzyme)